MSPEVERVLIGLGNTVLWTAVSIALVVVVIEVLNWRYHLLDEIFSEIVIAPEGWSRTEALPTRVAFV